MRVVSHPADHVHTLHGALLHAVSSSVKFLALCATGCWSLKERVRDQQPGSLFVVS